MQTKITSQSDNNPQDSSKNHLSSINWQLSGILKSNTASYEIEEFNKSWQMLEESLQEFEADLQLQREL